MSVTNKYQEYLANLNAIAYRIKHEEMVPIYSTNAYGKPVIKLVPRVKKMVPEIYLIEEFEMNTVLGDYGAGKVIKTINLAPKEKRTITMKTYKESKSTRSFSKNILDSFSEESAEELESMVENESSNNTSDTTEVIKSAEVSAEISGGFGTIGKASASGSASASSTSNSSREEMARQLSTAMDKHTAKSSANREIEINDTTTESVSEGSERLVVRDIFNENYGKTQNLVARQMEQEFISAIILKNVKIGFCNGTRDSIRYAKLFEMDKLLEDVIEKEDCRDMVKCMIIKSLMHVKDMVGNTHQFIEEVEEHDYVCSKDNNGRTIIKKGNDKIYYWRKNRKLLQKLSDVRPDLNNFMDTNGVILDVKVRVLRTDGVVLDTFLGNGEALDCFNQKLQDQATQTEIIKNEELELKNIESKLKLKIIESIDDPLKQAEAYQRMFLDKCVVEPSKN